MPEKYTVLIADDEKIDREAYKQMLSRGVPELDVIGEVDNGASAVEFCAENKPDIVLMDISMPGLNGMEAIRVLRRERINTSVVIISAYDYFEHAKEALDLGVLGFLVKPVSESELGAEMRRVAGALAENRRRVLDNVRIFKNSGNTVQEVQDGLVRALRLGDARLFQSLSQILGKDVSRGCIALAYVASGDSADEFFSRAVRRYENRIAALSRQTSRLYVLLLEPADAPSELLSKMREAAREGYRLEIGFSAGLPYDSPAAAARSLMQAVSAFEPRAGVFAYAPGRKIPGCQYPYDLEIKLIKCLQSREDAKCCQTLDAIFADVGTCFDMAKFLLWELSMSLSRLEAERGIADAAEAAYEAVESIEELRGHFLDRVQRFLDRAGTADGDCRKIRPILDYIREHYNRDIPLSLLAKRFFFSQGYLGRLIRETTSLSYTEFVMNLRLDRAKELLRGTPLSIGEISATVGYKDQNYFTKVFKKATGCTPQRFRAT